MTLEQFEYWSLVAGIGGLILWMLFIIWRMAKDSRAGRWGYFILFLVLGLGVLAFVAKTVMVEFLYL